MARTVRDSRLDTRTARLRLKPRHEPYWRTIESGAHLGYRKGPRGGAWLARRYLKEDGCYRKSGLGKADDALDADGLRILSFAQAQEKAREWFKVQDRMAAGEEPVVQGPYTVANAIADYLAEYEAEGKKDLATVIYRVNAFILPALGAIEVAQLSPKKVKAWRNDLAKAPARLRTRPGDAQRHRAASTSRDYQRRRRHSANKVLTILKAALNLAWREGKAASDDAWRRVRPFQKVNAPVIRYLTDDECVRLVNACQPAAFRQLVRAAIFTGCRYSELAKLRAADFNPDAGTLAVRESKTDTPRHVTLTDEAQRFFAEACAGRVSETRIFLRDDGHVWGKSHQQRPMAEACRRASIEPAIGFHILRHCHGSRLAMAGVSMQVIAHQLGHADTRITEKHYAHLAPSYVSDTLRAALGSLGILEPTKVVPMQPKPSPAPALAPDSPEQGIIDLKRQLAEKDERARAVLGTFDILGPAKIVPLAPAKR